MADGSPLPGVEHADDGDRLVLHVDADCFYAACERLREPALRGEPLVVGMGYEPGESVGAVATASYEAREFGVESAMAITEALERLPRRVDALEDPSIPIEESGHYRPVDKDFYGQVSEDVHEILRECADVLRVVSVDEAYLDVTERTAWGVVEGFARHVKDRIRREVGVTVSVGVAPTMSAAKIASDFDKPDGLTVIRPGEVASFLEPLDVERLHGVGPVTARELRAMGLETAGDVAGADPGPLIDRFGKRGRELLDRARGEDDRLVEPRGLPKSFSRESAFAEPAAEWDRKRERLETLADAVAERARREGALYRTVGIKAVTPPYEVNTRERSLSGPVDDPDLVCELAIDLFEEFADRRVRKLGVRVANLEFTGDDQSRLSGWDGADATSCDGEDSRSADVAESESGDAVWSRTDDVAGEKLDDVDELEMVDSTESRACAGAIADGLPSVETGVGTGFDRFDTESTHGPDDGQVRGTSSRDAASGGAAGKIAARGQTKSTNVEDNPDATLDAFESVESNRTEASADDGLEPRELLHVDDGNGESDDEAPAAESESELGRDASFRPHPSPGQTTLGEYT